MTVSITDARAAKTQVKKELARVTELVGVGLTRKGEGYAVKVNLRAAPRKKLPTEIAGVPLVVEVVGSVKAF